MRRGAQSGPRLRAGQLICVHVSSRTGTTWCTHKVQECKIRKRGSSRGCGPVSFPPRNYVCSYYTNQEKNIDASLFNLTTLPEVLVACVYSPSVLFQVSPGTPPPYFNLPGPVEAGKKLPVQDLFPSTGPFSARCPRRAKSRYYE